MSKFCKFCKKNYFIGCRKYCSLRCKLGKTIKAEDKIYFPKTRSSKSLKEYNKIRKSIFIRDEYTCQFRVFCKPVFKLEVHHIDTNPENNNPQNLVTLCNHCHQFFHFISQPIFTRAKN